MSGPDDNKAVSATASGWGASPSPGAGAVAATEDAAGLQAQRMQTIAQFTAGLAHDFANLIGVIEGFATYLFEDAAPSSTQRDYASRIVQASQRAADIARQLLAFARGGDPGARAAVDMRATLLRNEPLLRAVLPASARLVIAPGTETLSLLGDETQLCQLLFNLCLNAADALRGETGRIAVTLENRCGADHARRLDTGADDTIFGGTLEPARSYGALTVADSGVGMDRATLGRIFDSFFTTRAGSGGTGLGLTVVQTIVLAWEGAYAVRSRPGQGTDVTLYLPLV